MGTARSESAFLDECGDGGAGGEVLEHSSVVVCYFPCIDCPWDWNIALEMDCVRSREHVKWIWNA